MTEEIKKDEESLNLKIPRLEPDDKKKVQRKDGRVVKSCV